MTNPPSTSLFENYINKGLSGLANIGNTCYLNSCIQVLSHTYEFNQFLKKGEYKQKLNKITDSIILLEWDKLREMLWSANCTVAPYGFVKSMQRIAKMKNRDIFSGYAQNDMQEFLLFLIDCFHNALAREVDMEIVGMPTNTTDQLAIVCYDMMRTMYKKEYSEMLSIFYGIQVSEITAFTNQATLSARPEPFSVLSLSIPDEANKTMHTLYDCFDLYCTPEDLTQQNGNAWFNDKTQQKEDVQRGISFWSLPEILIIDLKRWHGHKSKLHMKIDAPLTNELLQTAIDTNSRRMTEYGAPCNFLEANSVNHNIRVFHNLLYLLQKYYQHPYDLMEFYKPDGVYMTKFIEESCS